MEIELVDEIDNHVKYGIIYTREDIESCLEKEAEAMQPEVKVNGFRPGKVPVDYIIRIYGEKLRIQATNKKITSDILGIIEENKYDLASQPVYNFRPRQEIDDSNFYVELDLFRMPVLPELALETFDINQYQPNEEGFQEILDKNLLMFQIMTADFENVEDKPSQESDRMLFSVDVIVNGEPVAALSGRMQAILGQEQVPLEIEEQLKGKKSGEEIIYTHHYPEDATDLFSPMLAGTETTYKIIIEKIERPIIKELDESRIQKIGFRDYEHLFEILEGNTRSTLQNISFSKTRHDFLVCLYDAYKDVAVPEFILNQEAHHIAMAELSAVSDEDIMKQVAAGLIDLKITEEHLEKAKKNVQFGLFVRHTAKQNNIIVTDSELKAELEKHLPELTRLNSIRPDDKEKNYRELAAKSRMIVLESKVLQSVFERINFKEVLLSKDDYFDKVKKAN